ncbi:hypothetical protein RUM44_006328 [Polyplax serrata]|uniref:Uncharacterized protein n=1 Tax=Polyplax serrata TaxID=468196 RepID=A0ABR1AHV5_POLSC
MTKKKKKKMNRKESTSKRSTGNTRSVAEKRSGGRMVRLRGDWHCFRLCVVLSSGNSRKYLLRDSSDKMPSQMTENVKISRWRKGKMAGTLLLWSGPYFVLFLCCLTNEPANDRNSQLLGSFLRQGDVVVSDKEELSGVSRRGETKELKNQKERYRVGKVKKALEQVKQSATDVSHSFHPRLHESEHGYPGWSSNNGYRPASEKIPVTKAGISQIQNKSNLPDFLLEKDRKKVVVEVVLNPWPKRFHLRATFWANLPEAKNTCYKVTPILRTLRGDTTKLILGENAPLFLFS